MKLTIFTDGGSRGNPGPAGIGVVIYGVNKKIIGEYKDFIGEATNNVAEYKALILALEKARQLGGRTLVINMDSELIVRQMNGQYKIKEATLKELAAQVFKFSNKFESVTFRHVERAKNKEADRLVNQALDEALA